MIILKVKGGIGNQMFQYAFARWLQEKTGDTIALDASLMLDKRYLPTIHELVEFVLNENVISFDKSACNMIDYTAKSFIYQLFRYGFAGIGKLFSLRAQYKMEELFQPLLNSIGIYLCADGYVRPRYKKHRISIVEGYWQNDKYFPEMKDILIKELRLKKPQPDSRMKIITHMYEEESVCVHIRRGNYVTSHENFVCTLNYYVNAMDEIEKRVSNPSFFIFSDDIDWAKSNLPNQYKLTYIERGTSFEDINLMNHCKHFVMSNSSFSWWGQYLSANLNKVVIAPDKWYATRERERVTDIYQSEWILLPTD